MYYSTAAEMERLDEIAVAHGLEIRQMMELAGFHMVSLFRTCAIAYDARVVILAGRGNKGGDGLAAARHLINHGWHAVSVIYAGAEIKPDPAHHRTLLTHMQVPQWVYQENQAAATTQIKAADIIIDSLIGYHLDGAPRDPYTHLITTANAAAGQIIAYDLPSGLSATTGAAAGVAITATTTLTLALPKQIFLTESGRAHSGTLYLADIGIPAFLYDQIASGCRPDFSGAGVIEVGTST